MCNQVLRPFATLKPEKCRKEMFELDFFKQKNNYINRNRIVFYNNKQIPPDPVKWEFPCPSRRQASSTLYRLYSGLNPSIRCTP